MIPQVAHMALRTGSGAIFDFSMMDRNALRSFLQKTAHATPVRDIKISAHALMDPSLKQMLEKTGVQNIWVECSPQLFPEDITTFLKSMSTLQEDYRCFPIIGDLNLVAEVLTQSPEISRIVLKGCEASGFVSSETTLALFSAVKERLRNLSKSVDIFIWGSIFTPEAAAAFLSTGAKGIVFESLHWLTDMVPIDNLQRRHLANLRLDSTDLAGLDLRVPCRFFTKGNSIAFNEIKRFESSLYGADNPVNSRRDFAGRVNAGTRHPLESCFTPDELIPLGVETAFAASFVERFGTGTEAAVKSFMGEIRCLCRLADEKINCFCNSPVAAEMGIRYPFIQGAMTWITDVPEFASKVAEAGGLPTIALGMMDADTLDRRLEHLPEIMGERPYAVNIVSLAENPFRELHLAWIKRNKPRFVVIAGGDISPVRELTACGIGVMYIAPDEAMLRLALEAGIRYVICEGYEAGGHVGRHSTLTLAQRVLDMKRIHPLMFQDCRIVIAGGIFNRETAFIAAMLGADAIQMGTAYLSTREIVETGALSELYQRMILESLPGGTIVSGQHTGLRVRSLSTPSTDAVLSLERNFALNHHDEQSFRMRIEEITAGSLFTAARGMDRPGGMPLDEQTCIERGQFMSGACAGLISQAQDLQSFHREMAEGSLCLHHPCAESTENLSEPSPCTSHPIKTSSPGIDHRMKPATPAGGAHERIAITGMSILNALGNSPEEVWAASLAMKNGITLVPPSRWDHDRYYNPRPLVPDKTYCKVGAFLDFHVSRDGLGIPPHDFRTMTSATKITMWLADRAIRASRILASDIPRERIGVLISQNSGEAAGTLSNIHIRAYVHDILSDIKRAIHLTPDQEHAIERELKSGRLAPDDTTLLGRLNCAAGGFLCNRYGFMGPSYSISAACASSLVALHSAVQMIRNGIIDAAIVGGGEEYLTHLHFLEFSALGALFGLSGQERPPHETSCPFDAARDGMVLGEGGGMIVIERESAARARGALVHAIITGMGASNNHLGMVESSHATQEIAIRASFQGIPYGPDAVDLVECHATSTRQGDAEEVRALKTIFNSATVITSFKSQIGHTLGASGINSLIRGVMAMKYGVFPPTLNYKHPDPEIGLEGSGLFIATEPLDWKCKEGRTRRIQVNAFGFGGSNYVVQLEQSLDEAATILVSPGGVPTIAREKDKDTSDSGFRIPELPDVKVPSDFSGETVDRFAEIEGISLFRTRMDGRNYRMAVVAESKDEARSVIERSRHLFRDPGIITPKTLRSLAQQGLFMDNEDIPAQPLAWVFPGQGTHYAGMGQDLYDSFPVIKEWMDRAAAAADFDLLHHLFHDREENLQKTRWQQPALFVLEYAIARYLLAHGIHPVAMAGHSLGELTALCLSGVYSLEDGFRIVNKRALCMDKAAAMHVDPGVMAATDAPLALLKEMIRQQDTVYICNINSPKQIVLGGNTEAVKHFGNTLKAMGYRTTLLRVSMAFHSPIMRVIHDDLESFVAAIPFHSPQIPVISNTTMAPYPSDTGEIRRILMAHLESPVHWMNNVQTIWNDYGVRRFVEVGPGDVLSGLIADIFSDATCIQTCLPGVERLTCRTALAQLFVQGHVKVQEEPVSVFLSGADSPPEKRVSLISDDAPDGQDLMERLIHIIMDATGFERNEIHPDMDIRKDLSIRSSRLPIIMDAAEHHFGITIELHDFIPVRTVKDIAQKISEIIARKASAGPQPDVRAVDATAVLNQDLDASEDKSNLTRLVFNYVPVDPAPLIPMHFEPGASVLLLSPDREDHIADRIGDIFRKDHGVGIFPLSFMQEIFGPIEPGYDIRTADEVRETANRIEHQTSLAGMVISLHKGASDRAMSMADISRILRGLFILVKAFLQRPNRKFVVLVHSREDIETPVRLAVEGMTGLFLSASQEHPDVQFRALEIDRDTDIRTALCDALNRGYKAVEMAHRDGKVFTLAEHSTPLRFSVVSSLDMKPGDVVVMSGGATGISAHLARSLAPFKPCLVFLGRTHLGDDRNTPAHPPLHPPSESFTFEDRTLEITHTLADLHASGIDAAYYTCDVSDPEAVRTVMDEITRRYGSIRGIIHGAGVLRDGFLGQMTPDHFSWVTDIKFLGAWNLFQAVEKADLRFFIGLSSMAAVQGNPGQTNYAAANRMMSALIRTLRRKNGNIRFKALMLPPIEGAGMAENPDVRELMRRKGVSYIHVNELSGLFCRELFISPADDTWVMFMRTPFSVKTPGRNGTPRPLPDGALDTGTTIFNPEDFPMIEGVSMLDIRRGQIDAFRTFSRKKDLWIEDHRPLMFVKHPLVSTVMFLETFMEAARLLYPFLQVRGARQVQFLNMIQCPSGVPRPSTISCRRIDHGQQEVICEVSLAAQEISPTGRLTDRLTVHCKGQVILDGGHGNMEVSFRDFPVQSDELRTRPMDQKNMLKWYKKQTGLKGRYRVLEDIDGAGPGVVRGHTTYRQANDFANLRTAQYQYSPYLLEAILQLAAIYCVAMMPPEQRSLIPIEIGEMRFYRKCEVGEKITLEARMRTQNAQGFSWNARGLDHQGRPIMQVSNMQMHWVSS